MGDQLPYRAPVVGTGISVTSYDQVLELLDFRPPDRALVVAVCNVHSVMSARKSAELSTALPGADITTPDGVPLVWALRSLGHQNQQRVYGPELMRRALQQGVDSGWAHYLYGSTPDTLDRLESAIRSLTPEPLLVGRHSPPFRELTDEEISEDAGRIRESGANVVWVGLGMPKQELWMHRVREFLPGVTLVGVGAAFDLIAGTVSQAPPWMQRAGLEWLYRLFQEPRRLWRRYAWNNPAFLATWGRETIQRLIGRTRP